MVDITLATREKSKLRIALPAYPAAAKRWVPCCWRQV